MKRYVELDSLRGISALSVMLSHILLVYPMFYSETYKLHQFAISDILKYTPLHIFWVGQEAVLFFFILSGFVLSLPYINNRQMPYKKYITKRICRIYIPYITTLLLAYILRIMTYSGKINFASDWFNELWVKGFSLKTIFLHIGLIPNFDNSVFNPVVWSLVHEMRISILFPFLIIPVLKYNWKVVLGICFLLSLFSVRSQSFHYASLFLIGGLIAKNQYFLTNKFRELKTTIKTVLFLVAALLYTIRWTLYDLLDKHLILREYIIVIGIILFIIMALASAKASKILNMKPVAFLGKISYSLYLVHLPILLGLVHILHAFLSINLILVLAVVLSFITATLTYYLVELPSISLGKRLTEKL